VGAAYPFFGAYGEAPERRMLFRGEEDKLEFVTQAPAFPTGVTTAFTAIVLALEDTGQGRSLVIRQRILPNREPFSEAAVVLRDSTIQGLELRYLVSEGTWSERWDGDAEKRLPAAITIRFSVMRAGKLEPAPPMTVSLRTVAAQ
jgi:hypothetical protein